MTMGNRRNRLVVGALLLVGFLSSVNAAERLRGVRQTTTKGDGEQKSTKIIVGESHVQGYEPEAEPNKPAGRGRDARPAVLPNQIGNQNVFSNSIDRFTEAKYEAGKYKANIFQKSRDGDPPVVVYQEEQAEQDPVSDSSEVDEVSNDMDILALFEHSGKSFKQHKPKTSNGMKKLGPSSRDDYFHSFSPVSSPSPLPDMASAPYHDSEDKLKNTSTSKDGLKSKSLKHKKSIKSKKNKAYIHKYKLPSHKNDMPVIYDKKSKSKDGPKSERHSMYSYRVPHYKKPSFLTSSQFPSVSPSTITSLATAQPSPSVSPTFPDDTRITVAPTTMATTPSVATTTLPSTANALEPTMMPTTPGQTPTSANTMAPTVLPLTQTASPTQQEPVSGFTVSPTAPVDPTFPTTATTTAPTQSLSSSTLEPTTAVTDPATDVEPTPIIPTDPPVAGLTDVPTVSSSDDAPFSPATTSPTTSAPTPSLDSSTTIEPTPIVTSVVEPTPMVPTDSPIVGLTPAPTRPPSELPTDAPFSTATTSPTTPSLDSSSIEPTPVATEPTPPLTTTNPPTAVLTPLPTLSSTTRDPTVSPTTPVPTLSPTVLSTTRDPTLSPTTPVPTMPPTVSETIVVTASPTVPEITEPTIMPPSLTTVPPNPDSSPTIPRSSPLPSVEVADDLEPCEDDPKCIVLQTAIFDVFPLENRANIGIPGTCQNWAREWMRSDPIFNAGLDIERTRQRYTLAEMYCELQGDGWTDQQQFLAPVDECEWFTTSTEDICNMDGIIEILRMPENNMAGTMPPELSMMSSLQEITFESNSIQGSVPEDYVTMSNLRSLDLSSNTLDGPIPEFVWDLIPLEVLDLSNNGFTGFIPAIIMTENLRILSLSNNEMSGEIPALFGLLNWDILHLDNNQFSGTIPQDLSSPDIQELLLHNNQLTGTFPADDFVSDQEFAELLTTVMIQGNTLTGDVNSMCVLNALETFVVDPSVGCDCCQPAP